MKNKLFCLQANDQQLNNIYRIKRFGRDDLNYQANPPKVYQLKGTKTSFPFLTSNKL